MVGQGWREILFLNRPSRNFGTKPNLKTLPSFHTLHGDPRFKELLEEIGFD
jgi:hypothetical protein